MVVPGGDVNIDGDGDGDGFDDMKYYPYTRIVALHGQWKLIS